MPTTGLLQHSHARIRDVVDVVVVVPGLGGPADDDGTTGTHSEAAAPATADPGTTPGTAPGPRKPHPVAGLIRVHRGRPTDEELAAVVTVLLARANTLGPAEHPPVRSAPRWRRHGRGLGYRTAHSWQAERRPRRTERGAP